MLSHIALCTIKTKTEQVESDKFHSINMDVSTQRHPPKFNLQTHFCDKVEKTWTYDKSKTNVEIKAAIRR